MADSKHLAKLNEGIEAWNLWRKRNPIVTPNLTRAYLRDRTLTGVDFSYSELVSADLGGANLTDADLTGAVLAEAKLALAGLFGTNLSEANLRGADLSGAFIYETNLNSAELDGADLRGAVVADAIFSGSNLANVKGLDTVEHLGPSAVSIDTLYLSRGNIPESFLRGTGVPEDFITKLKLLDLGAAEYYSCFVSHSSKDRAFVTKLLSELRSHSVRCWFAPEDLKIGDKFQESIEESIRAYDKLLIVLSKNSINSTWVEREVQAARAKEDGSGAPVLFPIRLDETFKDAPQAWAADLRRTRHIGDFRKWKDHDSFQKSLDRLLRDLKS